MQPASPSRALAIFAKIVVFATLWLIFTGGHTTTTGAGMAFPDWPLSHGSLNPEGWWQNMMMRLEHGHRMTAETVGVLIGVLCAWIWRSKWGIPIAAIVSIAAAAGAHFAGQPREIVAHIGLWTSAAVFAIALLCKSGPHVAPPALRWTAFAAFLGVVAQAVLGGMRVIHDPQGVLAGSAALATTLRIAHGCFAQIELSLLVAIATMLSPAWHQSWLANPTLRAWRARGWLLAVLLLAQLALGATMRHHGAGLVIDTFPRATHDGAWLPDLNVPLVAIHFFHSRIAPVLVSLLALALAFALIGRARGEVRLIRPAALLIVLLLVQVALGIYLIVGVPQREPVHTTSHVVNGALLLATTVWLSLRAGRAVTAS